ncbi:MAG: ATP synthase F1 subunit epsilon [Eubacteriales bacterium]|nr:ATP synthase F1 subunit epsilon [Eubacteriales bacterium]
MADTFFSLKIIATNKVFYDGKALQLIVPTLDGGYGIMAHHEELLLAVEVGELDVQKTDGSWERVAVGNGSVQVAHNRVIVLVDTAETPEEIDKRRAEEAMERAKEQLRQKKSVGEYRIAQASLARALSRLRMKDKGRYL